MKPIFSFLVLLFTVKIVAQTHFTIPQNVWRFTLNSDYTSGNWKSKNLSNRGIRHSYPIYTKVYSINQYFKRSVSTNSINIEYGFTDITTLVLNIPYISKITQNHSWSVSNDSSSTALDSLFKFYYPLTNSNKGLSDITIGINLLMKGSPAWRGGKQRFSFYSGFDMIFPFAETLKKYNPVDVGLSLIHI